MATEPTSGPSRASGKDAYTQAQSSANELIARLVRAAEGSAVLQKGLSQVNKATAVQATQDATLNELQIQFAELFGELSADGYSLDILINRSNSSQALEQYGSKLSELLKLAQQLNSKGDSKPLTIVQGLIANWSAKVSDGGWSSSQRTMLLQMIYRARNPSGSLADFGAWCEKQVADKSLLGDLAAGVLDDNSWNPSTKTWLYTDDFIQGHTLTPAQQTSFLQGGTPQFIVITKSADFAGIFSALNDWFADVAAKGIGKDSEGVMNAFSLIGFSFHQAYDNAVGRGINDSTMQTTISQTNALWSKLFAGDSLLTETSKYVARYFTQLAQQYAATVPNFFGTVISQLTWDSQHQSDDMAANIAKVAFSGNLDQDTEADTLFAKYLFGSLNPEEAQRLQDIQNLMGQAELKAQQGQHETQPSAKGGQKAKGQE